MASERYPYPAELDSDDEGSIEYDWENDSQRVDDDDLPLNMGRLQLGQSGSAVPATPPPGYSSLPNLPQNNAAGPLCAVCKRRPRYNKNGRSYPTCGLTCAAQSPSVPSNSSSRNFPGRSGIIVAQSPGRATSQHLASSSRSPFHQQRAPRPDKPPCVVCKTRSVCRDYVTCGLTCAEKFCNDGPSDATLCTYCHRRPKIAGKAQCGQTCADKAKIACLLCKVRPKNGRYQLCGRTCKRIAMKSTPLILEIPKGHTTYEMVENKFKNSWTAGSSNPLQKISKIFKIIENNDFLRPYDQYRKRVGPRETYRYHGTGRQCQLGSSTTKLCTSSTCPVCNILKTSFNVSIAKGSGAFGAGIYTSSASNKAYSYCLGPGALLLTKVVLGKVKTVNNWNEVSGCPPGFNSVVFDRKVGNTSLNETIVYSNDAIRPVFLIIFQ